MALKKKQGRALQIWNLFKYVVSRQFDVQNTQAYLRYVIHRPGNSIALIFFITHLNEDLVHFI